MFDIFKGIILKIPKSLEENGGDFAGRTDI